MLNEGKVDYDFIDMGDSENGYFEGKLVAETKQSTVPFIFLRGEFVGGFNEVNEVVRLGELAYRIRGDFEEGQVLPRIGMRGTAKLYGAPVTLGYYLLRRPLAP